MKNIIIAISCIALILSGYTSNAQGDFYKKPASSPVSATSLKSFASTKIYRGFLGYFKNASNLNWYQVKNNFLVKFEENGLENTALFTKTGQLVYHICYGTEKLLPRNIRQLVKSNYYDQIITRVLKVNQDRRNMWVVYMEDDSEYIMVRVEDMELEETKRMTKTK